MLCGALVGQLVVALSCHVTLREKEQAATIVAVVVVVVDSEKSLVLVPAKSFSSHHRHCSALAYTGEVLTHDHSYLNAHVAARAS